MEIKIERKENVDIKEFRKAISFISEDIISYCIKDHEIVLQVEADADCTKIKQNAVNLLNKFITVNKKHIYFFNNGKKMYHDVIKMDYFHRFEDGMISLKDEALLLFKYFERVFKKFAFSLDEHCEEKLYPVLLPITEYKKTGYLKNSPQYAMLCSSAHEDISILDKLNDNIDTKNSTNYINQPTYALSPSACFHTYIENKNKTLNSEKIVTFSQSVFRNEGRFNYNDFGRLRDYHVREVVFFGSQDYVNNKRKAIMDMVCEFIKELDLSGEISVASDPFIMPKLQKYKKIQFMENSKYELQLKYTDYNQLSVASFNIHGSAFTQPFQISIKNVNDPVTGCVGFGLERWVLAFLAQYGNDTRKWPNMVKEDLRYE